MVRLRQMREAGRGPDAELVSLSARLAREKARLVVRARSSTSERDALA